MIKVKKKSFRKFTLGSFLITNYGAGLKTCYVLSTIIGLNQRFRKRRRLRRKHVLIIKKKARKIYIGSKLKLRVQDRLLRLIKLKTYRGIRHKMKLPSHGQRTHTNGKTKKKFHT